MSALPLDQRSHILAELARYTGRVMPAAFFKTTADHSSQLGIDRFHTLLTGIYKPAWSEYALCIKMAPGSPYAHKDDVVFLADGRWLMDYSPRSGGLEQSDNQALVRCMDDHVPVGVIQQITKKGRGSTYKVLGLGIITRYDSQRDIFIVESADMPALAQISGVIKDEARRYEVQLYAQLTNEFQPFLRDENARYLVSAPKRDEAFRQVILNEYDYSCAICGRKFRVNDLVEAQAAHIIPKRLNGTDDPRNGLALCRSHHWAFDSGLWTLTSKYEISISALAKQAEIRNFELLSLTGKAVREPVRDVVLPHPEAIEWHRSNVWKGD